MKDFDFDELDRAVNSVLATKDAKNAQPVQPAENQQEDASPAQPSVNDQSIADSNVSTITNDVSNSVAVTEEDDSSAVPVIFSTAGNDSASHEEPAMTEEADEENSPEESLVDTDEDSRVTNEESKPEESDVSAANDQANEESSVTAAPLSAIPVKRGRFMDMVAPGTSSDANKKPLASRSGVTITPSADFTATETEEGVKDEVPAGPAAVDPATPVVEGEVEPEVSSEASAESEEAQHAETPLESHEELSNGADENVATVSADTTPFIPDVPVEKRPLNDLSEKTDSQEAVESGDLEDSQAPTADPTLSANVPKEFDKDIMAVEANETVGEKDETHPEDESKPEPVLSATNDADATAPALAATTAEPHPVFDTSTLAHPGDLATHHTSKLSWVIVAVSLFIVGAALGVLYFLYGQG